MESISNNAAGLIALLVAATVVLIFGLRMLSIHSRRVAAHSKHTETIDAERLADAAERLAVALERQAAATKDLHGAVIDEKVADDLAALRRAELRRKTAETEAGIEFDARVAAELHDEKLAAERQVLQALTAARLQAVQEGKLQLNENPNVAATRLTFETYLAFCKQSGETPDFDTWFGNNSIEAGGIA